MARDPLIRFLHQSGHMSTGKATEIAAIFNERNFRKGELFLREGRVSDDYLFLSEGFMRAYAIDTNGDEVTTAFFGADSVVFEVSSFFNRLPSRENICAVTDCEGWSITFQELNGLFHELPEFREFGRHILVKGFSALKERMLSAITETAEERYGRLLAITPELLLHAPLKQIASYIGVTDTSLSRIRKDFARKPAGG